MVNKFERTKKERIPLKLKRNDKTYEYNVDRIRIPKFLKKELQHIKIDCEFANEATVILALLNFFKKKIRPNLINPGRELRAYVGKKPILDNSTKK